MWPWPVSPHRSCSGCDSTSRSAGRGSPRCCCRATISTTASPASWQASHPMRRGRCSSTCGRGAGRARCWRRWSWIRRSCRRSWIRRARSARSPRRRRAPPGLRAGTPVIRRGGGQCLRRCGLRGAGTGPGALQRGHLRHRAGAGGPGGTDTRPQRPPLLPCDAAQQLPDGRGTLGRRRAALVSRCTRPRPGGGGTGRRRRCHTSC